MAFMLTVMLFFVATLNIICIDAFRSDYYFIQSTGSYFKFHRDKATWANARSTCESEGAILFHPDNEPELAQVLSVLDVGSGFWIYTGFSDLGKLKNYQTVEGRPISQVYQNWASGQPDSGPKNGYHCGALHVDSYSLCVSPCDWHRQYICKHRQTKEDAESERVKPSKAIAIDKSADQPFFLGQLAGAITNQSVTLVRLLENQISNSERQADFIQQSSNQATAMEQQAGAMLQQATVLELLTKTVKSQAANQSVALEQITGNQVTATNRQIEATQKQDALLELLIQAIHDQSKNQTIALEHIKEDQVAALNRQIEVVRQQSTEEKAALMRHIEVQATNVTAALEREAQALKKLTSWLENNAEIVNDTQQ